MAVRIQAEGKTLGVMDIEAVEPFPEQDILVDIYVLDYWVCINLLPDGEEKSVWINKVTGAISLLNFFDNSPLETKEGVDTLKEDSR